jgi:hypothetical protein
LLHRPDGARIGPPVVFDFEQLRSLRSTIGRWCCLRVFSGTRPGPVIVQDTWLSLLVSRDEPGSDTRLPGAF